MKKTIDPISINIPAGWSAEDAEEGDGWTCTLQSPATAFVLLSLRPDAEEIAQLADETLTVLKDDYPELDAEDVVTNVAGRMAIGHDIDLIALDATVTCRTRCLETPDGPLLIMCQFGERDPANVVEQIQQLVKSIVIIDE